MRVHLDTDLGADTDDLCALALLLGRADVELVGVTTSDEDRGVRAGLVTRALELAGRTDVPIAAGFDEPVAWRDGRADGSNHETEAYWHGPVPARPGDPEDALDLLQAAVDAGATIVAIGPFTNLARLEQRAPGTLARAARVVLMGGWLEPARDGYPDWGHRMDHNVQQDPAAARIVFESCRPLIATLHVCLQAPLREADLAVIEGTSPLADLMVHQGRSFRADHSMDVFAAQWPAVPDDLCNFQYDGVACAAAIGWDGVTVEARTARPTIGEDGYLLLEPADDGCPIDVVVDVDGEAFGSLWTEAVRAIGHTPARTPVPAPSTH